MGYMHIDNLYKDQTILLFKECYVLEKIHGTSAHVSWDPALLEGDESIKYFSGGEKYDRFVSLFDGQPLSGRFKELLDQPTVFFGEAYGGKQQGMSKTYGPDLKFVVFDVKVGESWLSVPQACDLAVKCGFDFVPFSRVTTDLATLDAERDKPSVQSVKNGVEGEHPREGVVLRPIEEMRLNNGARVIAKHKGEAFRETASVPKIGNNEVMLRAREIAAEWVVPMRMSHVLDKLGNPTGMEDTGNVIKAMVEDVMREGEGLVADNKNVRRAIGAAAANMYKRRVQEGLYDERRDNRPGATSGVKEREDIPIPVRQAGDREQLCDLSNDQEHA